MHTLLQLEKTDSMRTNVQSERRREARKNPRMGGNLGWGQGMISSFPNERIEHKNDETNSLYSKRLCNFK